MKLMMSRLSLRVCFSGLYSEAFFRAHGSLWFDNMIFAAWINYVVLWRVYFVVLVISITLSLATKHYGKFRRMLSHAPLLREGLAALVLPRVAPWHLLLSRILLATDDLNIHLDVLTKQDGLYQGRLADKELSSDGELMSITLEEPRRFKRQEYLADKDKGAAPSPDKYWKAIPTKMFLIMGSEVQTINFRYVPRNVAALKRTRSPDELQKVLLALKKAVQAAKEAQRKAEI